MFKKPVILTVHEVFGKLRNVYKGKRKGMLYRWFERILFWFSYTSYHCVSYYTMNALRLLYGIPDDRMQVIYNGVEDSFRNHQAVSEQEKHTRRQTHHR